MAQTKSGSRTGKTKKNANAARGTPAPRPIRREVGAAVCLLVGLFTFIGYFVQDYWLIDGLCLYVFKGLFGWGFWIVPPVFLWAAYILFNHRGRPVTRRLVCVFLLPLFFGALIHLLVCKDSIGIDLAAVRTLYLGGRNLIAGGVLSGLLAIVLLQAVSMYGALPVLIFALVFCVILAGDVSLKKIAQDVRERAPRPAYEREPEPEEDPGRPADRPEAVLPESQIFETKPPRSRRSRAIDIPLDDEPEPQPQPQPEEPIPEMPKGYNALRRKNAVLFRREPEEQEPAPAPEEAPAPAEQTPDEPDLPESEPLTLPADSGSAEIAVPAPPAERRTRARLSDAELDAETDEIAKTIETAQQPPEYVYPPVQLLRAGSGSKVDGKEEIALNRERLESTLRSFGIGAAISGVTRGPTVTRYDLELEAGVKLNKLTNLAGDLALSLGVVSVRIAPIPDKISTVGVEVPNKLVSTVYLHDIVSSPNFQNAASKLAFAIGKDIAGNCIVGNISKLPHMLIAGTTGSGKSVCINCLILSLLYKSTPDEVRLIMIDPKMVELGIYNGIPHLYIPVVTDPKKAAGSLQWAVVEMMKRYRLFSEVGMRNLTGYNNYRKKNGEPVMPNVVIVIDELADLMMTAAKEVEESICRVAQMGRAAGMHLVIATQRPSADVITGLMKANIPSRIAFAVSSSLESRIILDQQGAEKLIGMGDMLYAPLGCGKPLRVQGAYVSDEEREDVIEFIKQGSVANYDDEIMRQIERAAADKDKGAAETPPEEETPDGGEENLFSNCDELLPQAVDVIFDTKQASVSMLQRRLKLGYARAARLVDQMEEIGIVGPFEGSKPRQLLITKQQWQEMTLSGRTPMERLMDEQKDDYSEEPPV